MLIIYTSISYITDNLLIYFHKLQNNYFSYKRKGKKEIFTLFLDWYIANRYLVLKKWTNLSQKPFVCYKYLVLS